MPAADTASTIYAQGGGVWDPEVSIDTGTDTGADTDTDTDTGSDTGDEPDGFDPTTLSAGEVLIGFAGDLYGQTFEDQCIGTIDVTVQDKAITGTLSCGFQGQLATFIPGEQTATVSGSISDTTASGSLDLQISDQTFSLKWDGTTDGTAIYGAFEGDNPFEAGGFTLQLSYSGGFHATK